MDALTNYIVLRITETSYILNSSDPCIRLE